MAAKQKIARPLRGEVYFVAFDPTLGAEIRKTRPALILQNDIANRSSPITIVAAISTKFDEELSPTEVPLPAPEWGLDTPPLLRLNKIVSIDREDRYAVSRRAAPETLRRGDCPLIHCLEL